jgi:UDP-MurNAc hydroxylase
VFKIPVVSARIDWVNHASFIYDDGHIRLICDPWLEGRTFYNGWDLLAPTAMSFDEFDSITHIWISHEHPDHLSPPNLARIAPETRARITVLYQATPVRRVVKYLSSLGFREVVELPARWTPISPATDLLCGSCRSSTADDSYLALRTGGVTTLNFNDCAPSGPSGLRAIEELVGPPDVMLAQFSFACWTGNRDQLEKRVLAADMAESAFMKHVRALRPRFVIPSASFSWFCNAENYWMNETSVHVEAIAGKLADAGFTPIVLFPGDEWQLLGDHDNASAIERYNEQYDRIKKPENLFQNPTVDLDSLKAHALTFSARIKKANQPFLLSLLRSARIFLDDHSAAFRFSLRDGLKEISETREACDVALGSDSLDYCFKYLWGGDTLNINGRFEKPPRGLFSRFRIYFAIAALNNSGIRFDFAYLARNVGTVFAKFLEYRRGNDSLKPTV